LVGNIELHLKSSDWRKHGHSDDAAYSRLILHVVLDDDEPGVAADTPVLVMADRIQAHILPHYQRLMETPDKLPCATQHQNVKDIVKEGWLNRLLAERWEQKLGEWNVILNNTAEDWRNLLYWRMAANFGFKVNAAPFLWLSQSIPLNILARHRDNLMQLEALLFGQAGMLEEFLDDEYYKELKAEYGYLRQKYQLVRLSSHLWKFLRMRPANFPTIRISQFASLIQRSLHLFSQIIEVRELGEIELLLDVTASVYWDRHFTFGHEQENASPKSLGKGSIQNIIINTIAPIQFLYSSRQGGSDLQERALQLLESVPAEKNNIIGTWAEAGWSAANAGQSQALIQLYNNYCTKHRCLECSIGASIIRSAN
jgi:hypothetical protein